jgi:hypothetical protein
VITALPSVVHTGGADLSRLADSDAGPGATYIGLVLMSGLCLAPMVMFGLGILCAAGGRRGRRIGTAVTVVIVVCYALSLIGSDFSWPELEYQAEAADTLGFLLLAVSGFLMLPWLVAFGGTKVVNRGSGTTAQ